MLQYLVTWAKTMKKEEGQDMAEYALLIGLIAVVVVAAVIILGPQIAALFTKVGTQLNAAS
jgi:pilus assembly protein Flp/PilA